MKKQLSLVLVFVVLFMGFSGCIFKGSDNSNNSSDGPAIPVESVSELVVIKNIPADFEYLGTKPVTADAVSKEYAQAENVVEAAEGIYKSPSLDYYLTVIEFADAMSAESFLTNYKGTFNVLQNNDTLQNIELTGHEATRSMSYSIIGGKQVPRYKYFWNNDSLVFIIGGNSEDPAVGLNFAKATGY
ncbi:hypothetical protein Metho_0218 [Methanomethylovorans hollandica DSM 15978]|uniref:DUF4367 domain-containing protein n=1 Tax=Methanomethylovorans hollandica (strain DSM 15978 / NBRC 107637 / DMS1) TaxID=867904 RepID=L0KSU9_METHD|nr:hypothetical protein [Methanomethylovorans hollandica]AGB48502.1 hypothetical protein Metho_0218 [Methanomethylovorans hollandica DSM 15978]